MNQESDNKLPDTFLLTPEEEKKVRDLAYVGFIPREIASSMEWPIDRRVEFILQANNPWSYVAGLIDSGRSSARADAQLKLKIQADSGNVDAIKTLHKVQIENRYNELINNMDDDEIAT